MARDQQFYGQNHHHNHHHHHHHHHQQHQMINQIQGFDETTNQNPTGHHHHHYNHQIFGSNSNMGMMIDFSKQQQIRMDHHHHHQTSGGTDQNQLLEDSSSSMRLCSVNNNDFPSEVNDERPPQRPSQGLSLSLSSSNPTSINLQSFELRPQQQEIYTGKSTHHQNLQHTQMMMMMMNSQHQHQNNNQQHHNQFLIGSSKYLSPAQELLSEFCSLGVKESDEEVMMMKHKRKQKGKQQEDWDTSHNNNDHQQDQSATTSSKKHVPPLHSLEFMELQKRKAKLLSMLEELKRRYGHYREQMRLAAAGFEAAVGVGAAEIYTALASRAMSRHFRCLKDGLVGQIQATSQALGEREDDNRAVSIAARGETPRLRLLDQALRQQKSYRQMSLVDAHPWRPQRGLPERAVTTLRAWLFEHFLHPYPSDVDKHILARQTGLSRSQVSNWFINARVRLWKPMIEEMYCEETRGEDVEITNTMMVETKPEPNQIIRVEPESLSSIVTKTGQKNNSNQGTASFGSTFDFSLYGNQAVTYAGEGGTRGDVSLTLGLQRNDGNGGVSLALSPVTAQGGPLYYSRDHMEEGTVQYSASMLDGGDQVQNLPYRNLMGAQLLHDIV
ncbi:putative homeobox BEL1 [Cardamine amara subsp. amara]|uniref:Homeobox BEL1 n=1 Tax=Cardamine amara subsp. amara TaxID=228776 RepID=A0ABD1C7Y1_CARAN